MEEQLRASFRELLDLSERYIREELPAGEREHLLANLPTFRRSAGSFPFSAALGGMEKFLFHAWSWGARDARVYDALLPYVKRARAARAQLGGVNHCPFDVTKRPVRASPPPAAT